MKENLKIKLQELDFLCNMEEKLKLKLQELNSFYNKNVQLKFGSMSCYHDNLISVDLNGIDPEFAFFHEFGHALKDKQGTLQYKKFERRKQTVLIYFALIFLIAIALVLLGFDRIIVARSVICLSVLSLVTILPIFSKKTIRINHIVEFQADRFAAKHLGRKPYSGLFGYDKDSSTHPAGGKRMAQINNYLKA